MKNEDPLQKRYLRWLWIGVVVTSVLAVPAVVHSHAAVNSLFNNPAEWIPNSLPEKQDFNHFLKHFSVAEVIMFAWDGSDLDSEQLARAAAALQPLCQRDTAEAEPGDPAGANFTEVDLSVWEDLSPEALSVAEAVRREVGDQAPLAWVRTGTEMLEQLTSSPVNLARESAIARLQGTIVGPDGEQTCLLVSLGPSGTRYRRDVIPAIRTIIAGMVGRPAGEIAVVGGPFEGATVDSESVHSIIAFTPPSALIAAILCMICLRSIPLTAVIVAVASIGEGLVLAAVYYTGTPMNAVLIVLPPLVFVLTVSAGIHLSNYYLDAASEFPDLTRAEAAKRAMKAGVPPCCLATGTTVVGLSSLLLVRLEPVRIFGGVASFGVTLTLILLFMVMPGAMVLTKPRRKHDESDGQESRSGFGPSIKRWMRRRLARPWPLILSFLSVAVCLSLGLPQLESSVNVPRMFLPDSDIRRQYDWFEEHVGPTVNGELLLTFPVATEDDDPLERLEIVGQAHRRMLEEGDVGGAMSALTFIPPIPSTRSLAATARRSIVRGLIRDPDSSLRRLGFIASDDKHEIWRISLQIFQHEQADYGDTIAGIRRAYTEPPLEAKVPVEVSLTGSIIIVQRAQEVLLSDLFRSFLAAFAVIALVMMLMLRNVIGGLLAMAPNLFPTVTLFGAMGLAAIPLDIGSVMSASVALGIAVDDTVHLLSRFGSRRARGLGQIRAAYGALAQCGWAMFQTTLVCGASLMAYWFSDFVPTSRFSLFMFALLASALLGVIFLLPTLMASPLGRFLSRTIGASPDATIYADTPTSDEPTDARRLPTRWQKSEPSSPVASRYDAD